MSALGNAIAALILLSAVAPATLQAKDWFDFDRHEGLRRVRAAVDKMEKIAPIPDLECKPNPEILRYCNAKLAKRLSFAVTDTFANVNESSKFQKGGPGFVYEIEASLTLDGASEAEMEMFHTLCTASMMAVRPKIGADAANRRFSTALRKSVNKSRTDDSETIAVGNPDTLITRDYGTHLSCTISAEDDYRLQRRRD